MPPPRSRPGPSGDRLIVVAGSPSAGKTSVVRALIPRLAAADDVGYLKVDVVRTREAASLTRLGWTCRTLVDEAACPDHVLFEHLAAELDALAGRRLRVVETAGLCARCAPYVVEGLALAVIAATAGFDAASKLGPLLTSADLCVVTHGDRLAQAEREVFAACLAEHVPAERVTWFDGLTGTGLPRLVRRVAPMLEALPAASTARLTPRSAPPRLYCSLCLGRRELPLGAGGPSDPTAVETPC